MNLDPSELVNDAAMNFPTEVCGKCGSYIESSPAGLVCDCTKALAITKALEGKRMTSNTNSANKQSESNLEVPVASEGQANKQEPEPEVSIRDLLRALPGAPSDAQIDAWKAQCKAVYIFPFDNKEMYIWRPLIYREWQMLKAQEALVKDETKFQEHVVMRAVLWPKIDPIVVNSSRAGLIQTLFSVIMQGSYFIDPGLAVQLVSEL